MTIFLDTSFIVAFLNKRDSRNRRATELWHKLLDNEWGSPITSDYIVDECYTLLLSRRKNLVIQQNLYDFIHGNRLKTIPKFILFRKINDELYENSWKLYNKFMDQELSFTDLTILAICTKMNIEYLASFDDDFDGKITRIY